MVLAIILSSIKSPYESQLELASLYKEARKSQKHSRREASKRTGVPEPTIRRFEDTGDISLRQFLVLCGTYGDLNEAPKLLTHRAQALVLKLSQGDDSKK